MIESSTHFFLYCSFFINKRCTLLSTIRSLDSKLLDCVPIIISHNLFANTSQTSSNSFKINNPLIDYILLSKRFDEPLFQMNILPSVDSNLVNKFLFLIYLSIWVILYSQVLSNILLSRDWVILLFCFLPIFYINLYTHIYIKTKKFIYPRVIFRFLPNLQRLNEMTKSVKRINLRTN